MPQPVFFIQRNLFANPAEWISNKGDSINKPPADFFEASTLADGSAMLITNGSTQAWGGALVSRKRGVPSNNGQLLNWLAWRFKFRFPSSTAANNARFENDLKVCYKTRPNANTPIRNVSNFSTQWNADTGQFQIDLDPPGWVDSGFVVPEIAADVWHTLEFRFWYDPNTQVFSVLSIQLDDQLYMIPESLQNVPMTLTNWEQIASLQLQNEVYAPKSSVLVDYDEGVLCWSDQRITMIPPEALSREKEEAEFWWPRVKGAKQELEGGDFDPFGPGATPLLRRPEKR